MAGQLEYYAEELKDFKSAVNKCDSFDTLNYLEFFLKEANIHATGISIDVENEISRQIKKFKENCSCQKKI